MRQLASCACLALLFACDRAPAPGVRRAGLVYGEDDRREPYEVPQELAQRTRSVAAVLPRSALRAVDGGFHIVADTARQALDLCRSAPFAEQPAAAVCTAALIDNNLVLTAGHCFTAPSACAQRAFVFDFAYRAPDDLPTDFRDVYACKRVLTSEASDVAIIELDRPVPGRAPFELDMRTLEAGEPLTVIGSAGGIPLKVDRGAIVLDVMPDSFTLDSDTFHGSSGSPVLSTEGALVGVLVRGQEDYRLSDTEDCYEVVRVSTPDAGADALAEQASYVAGAIQALCATQYPSLRVCGIAPALDAGAPERDGAAAVEPVVVPAHPYMHDAGTSQPNAADGCSTQSRRRVPSIALALLLLAVFNPRARRSSRTRS